MITRNIIISVWALEETLQKDEQLNINFLQPRSKRLFQTLFRTLRRRNLFSRKAMSACRNGHEMSFEEKKSDHNHNRDI